MILCGGDKVLFGLYFFSLTSLLIGGCIWGQGHDGKDESKIIGGVITFVIGGVILILAILVSIVKAVRSLHKKRQNAKLVSENAKPLVLENEQFKIINVEKLDNLVPQHGNNLQINNSSNHINDISADHFKVASNPFQTQSPANFTNRQIVDKVNGNNSLHTNHNISPVCYSNPVFESEKVYPQPFPPFTQTQKPNAAKNYSRSLYNAHLAGKL